MFIIDKTLGPRVSNASLSRCEGMMSAVQVVGFIGDRISVKPERDSGVKLDKVTVGIGKVE